MTVGIGLIGAGRMGLVFADHLSRGLPGARFIAVAHSKQAHSEQIARQFGALASYTDHRALLERQDIDGVLIATQTHKHVEIVKDAAAAGKHIFCEKPLALDLRGCDDAIAATARAEVKLQIGLMRRFDPAYAAAKQKIDGGVIGTPVMFKSTSRDPIRTGVEYARRDNSGGMLADLGIHDFDLARWLMSSEVVRVFCEGSCLVYPELNEAGDIDNAVISLYFQSGALGNVDLSRNAKYGYDIRAEVLGSKGDLQIGMLQQTPLLVMTTDGVTHDTVPDFMQRFRKAFTIELRDFVECIRNDRTPSVTGQDARAATAIALAATRSLDEARPVELRELDPDEYIAKQLELG